MLLLLRDMPLDIQYLTLTICVRATMNGERSSQCLEWYDSYVRERQYPQPASSHAEWSPLPNPGLSIWGPTHRGLKLRLLKPGSRPSATEAVMVISFAPVTTED
jgi:hypothetical protein